MNNRYKKHMTWVAIASCLAIFFAYIGSDLTIFGYHAWRKAQTFAMYSCFQSESIRMNVLCFFAPKLGFNTSHYFGLEAPILPLLQHALFPFDTSSTLHNAIVVAATIGPLLIFLLGLFKSEHSKVVITLIGIVFAIAYVSSPTTSFFFTSFQPNMLASSLMILAVPLVWSRKYTLAGVAFGLGVITYPQAALCLPLAVLPKLISREVRGCVYTTLAACGITLVYFGISFSLYKSGVSVPYHHSIEPNFSIDHFFRVVYSDAIGQTGISFIVAFLSALAFLFGRVDRKLFYLTVCIGFVMYNITFIAAFGMFAANTYYSYIPMTFGMVILASLAWNANYLALSGSGDRALLLALFISLFLPNYIIPLHRWGSSYVYTQLAGGQKFPCAPLSEQIDIPTHMYLDCVKDDPFCRVAIGRGGDNLSSNLVTATTISKFHDERVVYAQCGTYNNDGAAALSLLARGAKHIDTIDGWSIYYF